MYEFAFELFYITADRDVFHYMAMYFSFWHQLSSFGIIDEVVIILTGMCH